MNRGLGCATALIITLALLCATGIYLVASHIANTGEAREVTKQVEIRANADVRIAEINANAAVDMTQINADVTRDTSLVYLAHRMFSAFLVAAALVCLGVAALVFFRGGDR